MRRKWNRIDQNSLNMCKDGVLVNRKEHRKLELKGFKKRAMKIEDD